MDILELTAQYLLANENMDSETFKYLCDNRQLPAAKPVEEIPAVEEPAEEPAAVEEAAEPETELEAEARVREEFFGEEEIPAEEKEETEE